ncbi:MAG: 50S ribosomal protein L3 [Firmicutes bacterium]|jgi:large subunit ribosomal protein L3|nr:50S ribosomal protein L3 [Bacillota bacterium]
MRKGILGRKVGMTQIFTENGQLVPVTVIEATPNKVIQVKAQETDGYEAIQVGFGEKREKLINKPEQGHLAKAGAKSVRYLREFRTEGVAEFQDLKVGDAIEVDIFNAGELVDVTGTTKGKGFAGVIKRWGFARGPMAHGSMYHRRVGSLGAAGMARVFKGRKLPGRMGNVQRTIQGLELVRVDKDRNLLLVKGGVPGTRGSLVKVQASVKSGR